jgi:hypothetical protein
MITAMVTIARITHSHLFGMCGTLLSLYPAGLADGDGGLVRSPRP